MCDGVGSVSDCVLDALSESGLSSPRHPRVSGRQRNESRQVRRILGLGGVLGRTRASVKVGKREW